MEEQVHGLAAGDRIQQRWEVLGALGEASQPLWLTADPATFEVRVARRLDLSQAAERQQSEWSAWAQLPSHPNLTQAFEQVDEGGASLGLVEFVAGTHLGGWIGNQQLTARLERVLRFLLQICDGLAHARQHGVEVHGNLHPRNCLVAAGEVVKITDFGVARAWSLPAADEQRRAWLASPSVVRRMACLAPERFADPLRADARSDVYSLGVLLFAMLAGAPPVQASGWDEYRTLHERQGSPQVTIEPPALKRLLEGALEPDPSRRLPDVETVAAMAREVWAQVLASPPPSRLDEPGSEAQQHLEHSARLRAIGQPEAAWQALQRAAALQPDDPGVHWQRVALLTEQERFGDALDAYDALLQVSPEPQQAWLRKAVLLRQLEKNRSAMEAFDNALELDPACEEAWFLKGILLEEIGREPDAIAVYEHLLQLNPRHVGALSNQAGLLFSSGMVQESLTALNRALDLDPENAMLCFNKGFLLAIALQRFEEALPCLEKARTLDVPEAAEAIESVRRAIDQQRRQLRNLPTGGMVQ